MRIDTMIMGTKTQEPTISLCMIVRDEADWLADCLANVAALVSEILIVDTGSQDETITIAKGFGAKVTQFTWIDDFAAARNFSLSQATGDWILVLDADELLSPQQHHHVRALTRTADTCYLLTQRHYTEDARLMGFIPARGEYPDFERTYPGYFESSLVRLIPNHRGLEYRGRIHELLEHSIKETAGLQIAHSHIILHHYGHTKDVRRKKRKAPLYTDLGQKKARENASDAKSFFELGVELNCSGKFKESAEAFRKCLDLNPHDTAALVNLGYVLCEAADYDRAGETLKQALAIAPRSHEAYCNLGVVYLRTRKFSDAEQALRAAVTLNPRYINALMNLAQLYSLMGRLSEAAMVLRRAATEMPRAAEVKVLLGTVHLLAHNTAVAETYLRQALEDDPESPAARFELANLLVAKGEKSEARLMFAACIEAEKSRLPRLGKAQQDSFTERAMRALVELQDTCKDSA